MVDGPDAFRHMPLERSAEHRDQSDQQREERGSKPVVVASSSSVAESTGASKGKCKHQESDGYGFKRGYSLELNRPSLGGLHRIQVDAARAAFKLCRGHNGTLAMLAPWHASSNIDSAFRLRRHVDHDMGRRSQRG